MMPSDREMLRDIARQLRTDAAEAHVNGMALARRAARVELLAELSTDEAASVILAALVAEGVVTVEGDRVRVVDNVFEVANASSNMPWTSAKGGSA